MPYKDKNKEKQYRHLYYLRNKQKFLNRAKKWKQSNPEKTKISNYLSRKRNSNKEKLRHREYYEKNKKIINVKHISYRENNRELLREKSKIYYKNNKIECKKRSQKWREKNRKRYIAINKKSLLKNTKLWEFRKQHLKWQKHLGILYEKQKGICALCYKEAEEPSVDHIYPVALLVKAEIPEDIINDITNLQMACLKCNKKKGKKLFNNYSIPCSFKKLFISASLENPILPLKGLG